MSRTRLGPLLLASLGLAACGGRVSFEPPPDAAPDSASTPDGGADASDDAAAPPPSTLEAHYPSLPAGPGGPQVARALVLTGDTYRRERIDGPAATGLPGDVLLANDRVRVVVEAANRAIGACPFGGDVVDVDVVRQPDDPFYDLDGDPSDGVGHDELGEVSLLLAMGRTFRAEGDPEIVRDGSDGGVAAVRFLGHDTTNDFINLKSLFGSLIPRNLDPDRELGLRVAVTYVLAPGSDVLETHWSFLAGDTPARTTFGFLTDLGSNVDAYIPAVGFGAIDVTAILGTELPPTPWVGGQGDAQAWALGPADAQPVAGLVVVGVAAGLFGAGSVTDVIGGGGRLIDLEPHQGTRLVVRLAIGRELGTTGGAVARAQGIPQATVAGRLVSGGQPVVGARVGVVHDRGTAGRLDADDLAAGAGVSDADGRFAIDVAPGDVLVLVGGSGLATPPPVGGQAREGETLELGDVELEQAASLAVRVADPGGALIPAKVTLVGPRGELQDKRIRDPGYSGVSHGIAATAFFAPGAPAPHLSAERPMRVAPGRYRVVVSRGPEWSRHEEVVELAPGETRRLEVTLTQVVDTTGYVATDFHQHAQASADSPVLHLDRVMSYLAEGGEVIASSEHDVLVDYQPIVEALGYEQYLRAVVGVESTPWDYGHFNAWPLELDALSPNGGAPDWGGGEDLCLAPPELFDVFRAQGARVVQVNHARSLPGSQDFQSAFDRAGLVFDFDARAFGGVPARQTVPNPAMRIADGAPMFAPTFDAMELLNGFSRADADGDGDPEDLKNEGNFRDWMDFLSFGFLPAAVGNSDTHSWYQTPAAFPRSWVRVPDDGPGAIASGAVALEVDRTLVGREVPRDVIASGGPFVRVTAGDETRSAIGRVVPAEGGRIRLTVTASAPDWMALDTVEVFANQTWASPVEAVEDVPTRPVACASIAARRGDGRCAHPEVASLGNLPAELRTVVVDAATGAARHELVATFDLALDALPNRGATGDTWIVIRVTGLDGTLWPVVPSGLPGSVDPADLVDGPLPSGIGDFPLAVTNPILVDADLDGRFTAPFAP